MPMPMASCDFHRSCPASPGRANAIAMSASAAGGSGSRSCGSRPGITDPRRLSGLLFRRLFGIAALELLDAASGIDDLLLAGVEGMRLGGHLDLDHRVFLAVFPLHGLAALGVDRRAGEDRVVRAGVEKD